MSKTPDGYERTARLCWMVLRQARLFLPAAPRFAFPPKGIALIASVADVGHTLARNAEAHWAIDKMIAESTRLQLGDVPTVMMLRICLEDQKMPIDEVPFAELGIKGEMYPLGQGPKS